MQFDNDCFYGSGDCPFTSFGAGGRHPVDEAK